MSKIIFTTIFIISLPAYSANYLGFMGAGGEPKSEAKTIFDTDLKPLSKFIHKSDWETKIAFNGGHKKTEKTLKKEFADKNIPVTSFTNEDYEKMISNYENKILNNEIKEGDQLLLVIDTHGAAASPLDKTHLISTSGEAITNLETLGASTVSMDRLEKLVQIANKKNIKLAIVDLSCHSGNSLKLANNKTCVISSTGPNHYGYGGWNSFSEHFFNKLKKNQSLEDLFLESLKVSTDPAFPMISSPVGLELNDLIYDKITPLLYSYNEGISKLSNYIHSKIKEEKSCELEGFEDLKKLAEEVASITNENFNERDFKKFNEALNDYIQFQEKIRQDLISLNYPELFKTIKKCQNKKCMEYTVDEILSTNFDWLEKFYEKNSLKDELANVTAFKLLKDELTKNKDLKKLRAYYNTRPFLEIRTFLKAKNVANETHNLYLTLYQQKSKSSKVPNPCGDFKL